MMSLMEVADGVFRVDDMPIANAYLVVADDGLVLVDAGMPWNARRILAFITTIGRQPDQLRDIVLTHCDIDHVGSAAELKRLTGASVAIHERDAAVLAGGRPEKGGLALAALYGLLRFRAVTADRILSDGDMIDGFQVMHVPGHTAGSIALISADGMVFSGDALLTDKRGNIIPPRHMQALDPVEAVKSADKIKALQPTLLLAGHGAPTAS
jgi:glyoxylase-like metal-dependent hydrolase (beta-lactamase superfamily II)